MHTRKVAGCGEFFFSGSIFFVNSQQFWKFKKSTIVIVGSKAAISFSVKRLVGVFKFKHFCETHLGICASKTEHCFHSVKKYLNIKLISPWIPELSILCSLEDLSLLYRFTANSHKKIADVCESLQPATPGE